MHAIVLLSQFPARGELLEAHELETLALEATEDFTNETTLDTIRLDGDESAFGSHVICKKTAAIVRARRPTWQAKAMPGS